MNNIIVLLAIPRTGSNNICSLINKSNNIIYNSEDFNGILGIRCMKKNIKQYTIKRIKENNNSLVTDVLLEKYMQQYPEKYINFLSEYKFDKYKLFKLFYEHLPLDKIVNIFFINNKDSKKIILKRDLIEVYVSKKIAEYTGKWYNYDTSDIRIKIDFSDFLNFYKRWKNYYEILEKYKDINTIIINYNDFSSLSKLKQYNYLKDELLKINIKLDEKKNIDPNFFFDNFFKQSKTPLSQQVINYDEFNKLYNNYKMNNI